MYQIVPIVEGQRCSIDSYGFYVEESSNTANGEDHPSSTGDASGGGGAGAFTRRELLRKAEEQQFWLKHTLRYLYLNTRRGGASSRSRSEAAEKPTPAEGAPTSSGGGGAADDAADGGDSSDVASLHRYFSSTGDAFHGDDEQAERRAVVTLLLRSTASLLRHRVVASPGGLDPTSRRIAWSFFSGAMHRSADRVLADRDKYARLCRVAINAELSDVILRDLGRTFPTHCLFRDSASVGQTELRRILHAFCAFDPAVGYCQGMGFIVAVLLLHFPEEEAFFVFLQMMHGRQFMMRQLFLPGFPLLQHFFAMLRSFLKRLLPALHRHLEDHGVEVAFFAAQWFMTLFAYQLPVGLVVRLWDLLLSQGWSIVFRASITLLQWDEALMLSMRMEDILLHLKQCHVGKDHDEFIRRTLDVPISDKEVSMMLVK